MHPLARGESRARRTSSVDATNFRSRPSRSLSPAPQPPAPPHQTLLVSFLHALAFFTPAPFIPISLLVLPAFLFASGFLYAHARLRSVPPSLSHPHVPAVAILHLAHLICLTLSVPKIGPSRALIALGALPRLLPRRRLWFRLFLTIAALLLLASDTPANQPSHTARNVHSRFQKFSAKVRTQYSGAPRKLVSTIRGAVLARRHAKVEVPPQPLLSRRDQIPLKPNAPLEPERKPPGVKRRRLLAIVKDEKLVRLEKNEANESVDGANQTLFADRRQAELRRAEVEDDTTGNEAWVLRLFSGMMGVLLALSSAAFGRAANGATTRLVYDGGEWVSVSAGAFLHCAAFVLPFFVFRCIFGFMKATLSLTVLFADIFPRSVVLGVSLLVVPTLLQPRRREAMRRTGVQRIVKTGVHGNFIQTVLSMIRSDSSSSKSISVYSLMLLSLLMLTRLGVSVREPSEPLGFAALVAAGILLAVSWIESLDARSGSLEGGLREISRSSSSGDLTLIMGKNVLYTIRHTSKSLSGWMLSFLHGAKDLISHARTNKASWQVLNFLVLQSGMATVELIYAHVTHAAGFISISADNFFCTVALASGLFAIRVTARKSTLSYSYGFSRFESVCGFANGIMLIYVAVLVVLEAFERLIENDKLAAGHTFTVCVFGITGNILGLYFFPPETRRENHNVQSIYLHIWANTLAFASMAISTAITSIVPAWEVMDMVTAVLVAIGVIAFAVPLLIRSGRLLLLQVPLEKVPLFKSSQIRLEEIEGVVRAAGLRVWNLTPNCLVGSVRLDVAEGYSGDDEEVLYKARSVFASMGVPVSQCTVQISRVDATNPSVLFFHKRSPSGLGEAGIDLEALTISRDLREHQTARIENELS